MMIMMIMMMTMTPWVRRLVMRGSRNVALTNWNCTVKAWMAVQ